jgi:tryptophanyl-tRNA synthetase
MNVRPEAKNLITIHAALSGQSIEAIINQYAGQQFSGFKTALTDVAVAHLAPITTRMRDLLAAMQF